MTPRSKSLKVFAFGAVLAVAGTLALSAVAQPMGAGMHGGHGPGMGDMGMGMQMPERMLDQVNATPEQRAQIKQIMQAAAADMKAQHESGRALRERGRQLFTQPSVDAGAVEALRQKMLAQHDQASKRMMQAMLDSSKVLSAEQRVKLADTLKQRRDMMERHQRERGQLQAPKS